MPELPILRVASWQTFLESGEIGRLEDLLPAFLVSRRWFRAKTRGISKAAIVDAIPLADARASVLLIRVSYGSGGDDLYILPLIAERAAEPEQGGEEILAKLEAPDGDAHVSSALASGRFRDLLLRAIACQETFPGVKGAIETARTKAFDAECGADPQQFDSFVSRAEQSNTSVIYRGKYILKLFRKLEPGVNPDLEIGEFLTRRGFRNTPAVLGSIEYRANAEHAKFAAGILQQFVENKGDAWKYALESLAEFYASALALDRPPPARVKAHPLDLMNQEPGVELLTLIGPFYKSAELLGRRTAALHAALADASGEPDFEPELFTSDAALRLAEEVRAQSEETFGLLRASESQLTSESRENVQRVLALEAAVEDRLSRTASESIAVLQIRHHGDYHLGQLLWTGADFMIIDFEGEPARPLDERRRKALALRDVAGMLRSFHYAAFAALFGLVPGVSLEGGRRAKVEGWSAAWHAAISGAYLKAYFDEAGEAAFLPRDWGERRSVLDLFLLQKALYEIAYELNNRPEWLSIPVGGILDLLA